MLQERERDMLQLCCKSVIGDGLCCSNVLEERDIYIVIILDRTLC